MSRVERLRENKRKRKKAMLYFAKDIVVAVLVSAGILYCVSPSQVRERSMQPTVNDGDIVLVNKAFYGEPERGDIIVFKSSLKDEKGEEMRLIKRVIGISGDEITIRDNKVYVNNEPLNEEYIYENPAGIENTYEAPNKFVVPEDKVYVLGDHREVSRDSRQLGAIDKDKIIGKAFFRVMPFNDMGILK